MFVGQTDHLLTNEILRDKNFILNLYTLSNFQLGVEGNPELLRFCLAT